MPNLEDFAKHYFAMPVRIGVPNYTGDFADLVTTPKYATGLGALYFANEYMMDEINGPGARGQGVDLKLLMNKLKGLFSR
jgi:cell division protein FtsA